MFLTPYRARYFRCASFVGGLWHPSFISTGFAIGAAEAVDTVVPLPSASAATPEDEINSRLFIEFLGPAPFQRFLRRASRNKRRATHRQRNPSRLCSSFRPTRLSRESYYQTFSSSHFLHSIKLPIRAARPSSLTTHSRTIHGGSCRTCCPCPHSSRAVQCPSSS
jgi:hypothetical protein